MNRKINFERTNRLPFVALYVLPEVGTDLGLSLSFTTKEVDKKGRL